MQTVLELVNIGSDAVNIESRIRHREADMVYRGVLTVSGVAVAVVVVVEWEMWEWGS